jgi:hypothetical protein
MRRQSSSPFICFVLYGAGASEAELQHQLPIWHRGDFPERCNHDAIVYPTGEPGCYGVIVEAAFYIALYRLGPVAAEIQRNPGKASAAHVSTAWSKKYNNQYYE